MKSLLLIVFVFASIFFIGMWLKAIKSENYKMSELMPKPLGLAIGFVTNFFDTLGIGSFASTTAMFKLFKVVPDEKIPGTLNVGHALPIMAQALIFTAVVDVDMVTLISMIAASILGAWYGAGIVARLPKSAIQLGMGLALIVAAVLFVLSNLGLFPGGGESQSLDGVQLFLGIFGNFILGALMTLGIGLYAPCMILVSILGMSPVVAFPIMMGSCALLMPAGSVRFFKFKAFDTKAAISLTIGGVPAVLIAAYIVKSLPLETVRWLVVCVVTYTAITMLNDYRKKKSA